MQVLIKTIIIGMVVFGLAFTGLGMVHGQAGSTARIGVFAPLTIAPDAAVEVPIQVENVTDLYAIDIELSFDPQIATASDADPGSPGVQMGLGSFLDPGLLLYNEVDNARGIAHFVMTQVNPSDPKSGSGILLVLYLKGLSEGTTNLTVTNLQIADRFGVEIPSSRADSTLTVKGSAPPVQATAVPVVNPTEMIRIPTLAPTVTPLPTVVRATTVPSTAAEQVVPTAEATGQKQYIPAIEAGQAQNPGSESAKTLWLLKNWWIVLAAALVVAGLGIYLYRTR